MRETERGRDLESNEMTKVFPNGFAALSSADTTLQLYRGILLVTVSLLSVHLLALDTGVLTG